MGEHQEKARHTAGLTFHKGIDYAVVMRPDETTENALAYLYGEDRHVTKFGNLFAASPDMLAALKAMILNDPHTYRDCHKAALAAIAKAESR